MSRNMQAYLGRYKDALPVGMKIYHMSAAGKIFVAGDGLVREIAQDSEEYAGTLHTFINPGNLAHYVLGSPETNEEDPTNATVKFGVTEPHHHFVPHAHGVEHWVLSDGFSGCIAFDHTRRRAIVVKLIPGSMIYIPAMVPHMFYNRGDVPLITLIANGGLGIHHEKYAITKAQAEAMARNESDPLRRQELAELTIELESMDDLFAASHPERDMSVSERVSAKLYRAAEWFGVQ